MNIMMIQAIIWIAAGATLVMFVMRRKNQRRYR